MQTAMPPPRRWARTQATTTPRNADNEVSISRSRRRIHLNKDPFDVKFMLIK
jgi:hypothetical protein